MEKGATLNKMQPQDTDDSSVRTTIPMEPGERKDGNIGNMSRLKALMHRASQEEEQTERPEPEAIRRVSKETETANQTKPASSKTSSRAKDPALRQQILIESLRNDNLDLRIKLEASLQQNRQLLRIIIEQERHNASSSRNHRLQRLPENNMRAAKQRTHAQELRGLSAVDVSTLLRQPSTTRPARNQSHEAIRSSRAAALHNGRQAGVTRNDLLNIEKQQRLEQQRRKQQGSLARSVAPPIQPPKSAASNLSYEAMLSSARSAQGLMRTSDNDSVLQRRNLSTKVDETIHAQLKIQRLQEELEVLVKKVRR